jgi:hypothetical protein
MVGRALGFLEDEEQRNQGERGDHQELVVIDVSNDLCLLRDQSVERRPPGSGKGAQELRSGGTLECAIDCGDVRLGTVSDVTRLA